MAELRKYVFALCWPSLLYEDANCISERENLCHQERTTSMHKFVCEAIRHLWNRQQNYKKYNSTVLHRL